MIFMQEKINRKWCLVSRPVGLLKESDFELREETISQLEANEILVRIIYLSLDPANRG